MASKKIKKTELIALRIDQPTLQEIRVVARSRRKSQSAVIREFLVLALQAGMLESQPAKSTRA